MESPAPNRQVFVRPEGDAIAIRIVGAAPGAWIRIRLAVAAPPAPAMVAVDRNIASGDDTFAVGLGAPVQSVTVASVNYVEQPT